MDRLNKTVWICVIAVLAIVGCILILEHYILAPPVWIGFSPDHAWEAKMYQTREGSAQVYDGNLLWKGAESETEKVIVTQIQCWKNGQIVVDGKDKERISPALGFGGIDKPKDSDHLKTVIYWTVNGKPHSAVIQLKEQSGLQYKLSSAFH